MDEYRLAPDGIQARQVTKYELKRLQEAEVRLEQVRAPSLLGSPGDRVFVAAMDGTGNSIHRDPPEQHTIVGRLKRDIETLKNPAIGVGYVDGIGTQRQPLAKLIDGATGTTFQRRVEHAYYQLCAQAAEWIQQDPHVRIHLVGIGFSRGAEQVPALQRLIHERGIFDPHGAKVVMDADGLLSSITYANHPPLVPPGRTAQVALIIDPVATSIRDEERRFPASNVGVLALSAQHDARDLFSATMHVPEGLSEGGRVANFFVPGAHADVGGGYLINGIGRRVQNIGVDYLNALFGEPMLPKVPEPHDPRFYVIHSAEQHQYGVHSTHHFNRHGARLAHTELSPACRQMAPDPCARERVDHVLVDSLQWRHVERGRVPGGTDARMDVARVALDRMHERDSTVLDTLAARVRMPGRAEALVLAQGVGDLFNQYAESARRDDAPGMSAVANAYLETPLGQVFKPAAVVAQAWWKTQMQHAPPAAMQP